MLATILSTVNWADHCYWSSCSCYLFVNWLFIKFIDPPVQYGLYGRGIGWWWLLLLKPTTDDIGGDTKFSDTLGVISMTHTASSMGQPKEDTIWQSALHKLHSKGHSNMEFRDGAMYVLLCCFLIQLHHELLAATVALPFRVVTCRSMWTIQTNINHKSWLCFHAYAQNSKIASPQMYGW